MLIRAPAIVCAVRSHGEHGAIVRGMTEEHGLLAGYVRGGRSRRLRPVLSAGNIVMTEYRARSEDQLASLTVELVESRAPLISEPLAAAAIEWVTALVAVSLAEGHPYPRIYGALDGVLGAVVAAGVARDWAAGMARFEALVLAELGYGVDDAPLPDLWEQLRANGDRLETDLLTGRRAEVLPARGRLIDRLHRAMGR